MEGKEMNEWKISKTYAGGEVFYQVYRRIRDDEPDHSGNREVVYTTDTFSKAVKFAEVMNR